MRPVAGTLIALEWIPEGESPNGWLLCHYTPNVMYVCSKTWLKARAAADQASNQLAGIKSFLLIDRSAGPGVHPMQGDEIRALRRLQREHTGVTYRAAAIRGCPWSGRILNALRCPPMRM
jgi:hypothetical protein